MNLHNTLTASAVPGEESAATSPALFEGEGSLVAVGLLGVLISAGLWLYVWMTGVTRIGLEGEIAKAMHFDLAAGLFVINLAALLPVVGLSPLGRKVWRGLVMAIYLGSYSIETVQILRGYDPRFSEQFHSVLEAWPNILLGVLSGGMIISFLVLIWYLMRNRATTRPLLLLALRYGAAATLIAFAAGGWMITLQQRHVGAAGNIMWIHFVGFEGLKVLLLTGWLAERSARQVRVSSRWVHIAGVAWLLLCAMVAWQTAQGLGMTTPTAALVIGIGALMTWAFATLRASR